MTKEKIVEVLRDREGIYEIARVAHLILEFKEGASDVPELLSMIEPLLPQQKSS
jgi:hypothetical protein